MKKTIVVNLCGAPGAGKSTGSAYIFSMLKMVGVNTELVTEFAKDKIYEALEELLRIKHTYLVNNILKMTTLKDIDVIVTDAPLILLSYYSKKNGFSYTSELEQLVLSVLSLVDNVNYFINRCVPYDTRGRFQTEAEADIMADEMKDYLNNLNIKYKRA